ncbi:hypothetical protein L208DRAFT_1379271 [Tricholoma matsutake]|nr:hypothetical protein L208DRAFT_1379271 [Tricholoma matsutake 945]
MLAAGDASTRHGVENSQDIHIYLCSFVYVVKGATVPVSRARPSIGCTRWDVIGRGLHHGIRDFGSDRSGDGGARNARNARSVENDRENEGFENLHAEDEFRDEKLGISGQRLFIRSRVAPPRGREVALNQVQRQRGWEVPSCFVQRSWYYCWRSPVWYS